MSIKKIEKLWAFIADDTPEQEGIIGILTATGWVPLVTGRERLVPLMRTTALEVKKQSGKAMRLVQFSTREVIEEL